MVSSFPRVLSDPTKRMVKKRISIIVDNSVVSTLMTGIPKTDEIKQIVVHLYEIGKLPTEQLYELIGLLEGLKNDECCNSTHPQYKYYLSIARSLVFVDDFTHKSMTKMINKAIEISSNQYNN